MPDYSGITIPHARGIIVAEAASGSLPSSLTSLNDPLIRDLFLHAIFARVAYGDGSTEEFVTSYNAAVGEAGEIELDIPQEKLDLLCQIAIAPKMQQYMEWLVSRVRNLRKDIIHFTIGASTGVTPGTKGIGVQFGFDGEIDRIDTFADAVGNAVLDLWKSGIASYPPTVADSIVGTISPTLAAERNASLTDLTGWTTSFSQGEVLYFNVDAVAGIDLLTVALHIVRNTNY